MRQPINHGTPGGYSTHRSRGETPCAECKAAAAAYQRERAAERKGTSTPTVKPKKARSTSALSSAQKHPTDTAGESHFALASDGLPTPATPLADLPTIEASERATEAFNRTWEQFKREFPDKPHPLIEGLVAVLPKPGDPTFSNGKKAAWRNLASQILDILWP